MNRDDSMSAACGRHAFEGESFCQAMPTPLAPMGCISKFNKENRESSSLFMIRDDQGPEATLVIHEVALLEGRPLRCCPEVAITRAPTP